MILSAASRTDIPAFYSDWLFNRVKEGYVLVRNPFDPRQVTRYEINPGVVDVLLFCTKDPRPLMKGLGLLDAYRKVFQVTVTPYGEEIEPGIRDKNGILQAVRELSRRYGEKAVLWRYDPIFLNEKYTLAFHEEMFGRMARYLKGYTDTVIISFIDLYEKTKKNFPALKPVSQAEEDRIAESLVRIARENGMRVRTCLEGDRLKKFGCRTEGCTTREVIERACGISFQEKAPLNMPRRECRCALGHDIGMYNTCGHLCRYCYANYSAQLVRKNMALHDPASPLLIGHLEEGDRVHPARQRSYLDPQLKLDL